jgi:hypothetical protein
MKLLLEKISGDLDPDFNTPEELEKRYPNETEETLGDIAYYIRIINNAYKLPSGTLKNLETLVVNDEDVEKKEGILKFLKKYYRKSDFEGEDDSAQWGGRGGNKRKRTKKFKQNKRRKSARRLKRKN